MIHRYTRTAMALHWLQAGLVFGLLYLGWTMVDLPKGSERSAAYALHKSLGLCVILLLLVRLAWRRRHPPPPSPGAGWTVWAAHQVHAALYAFLAFVPLTGYLTTAFTPYPLRFFGLELPRLVASDEVLNAVFKGFHGFAVLALAALLALHIGAALWHGLRRDGTLSRMLPGQLRRD